MEILRSKGISEGLTFELLVGDGKEVRIGEVLKEQFNKVGIELKVVSVDGKSRDARVSKAKYEMALLSMGSWGLDADYLRVRYDSQRKETPSGGSATAILGAGNGYINLLVDELCEKQLHETDQEKRKAIIHELQNVLAQDIPEIPLYNSFYQTAYHLNFRS